MESVNFCTYQAVSGSGYKGINALNHALNGVLDDFYPCDISKTCLPQIGNTLSSFYTEEEEKMILETKKILGEEKIKISATCVRVPVFNCHGAAVSVGLKKRCSAQTARKILSAADGVKVLEEGLPLSTLAVGQDEVLVGRIRADESRKNGICFYCVADNVRKGAAANALQIAKKIFRV